MTDQFTASFVLDIAPAEAWAALQEAQSLKPSSKEAPAYEQWYLPGFPVGTGELLESIPGELLRVRKDTQPCEGTEILVQFEAEGTGTRVTMVQSGFGAGFFIAMGEVLGVGWVHIVADFALYLERRVDPRRHYHRWASMGCSTRTTPFGLEIAGVQGGFAAAAGLVPGDLLLTVHGAPIATQLELQTIMRIVRAGDPISCTWLRGRETLSATAPI